MPQVPRWLPAECTQLNDRQRPPGDARLSRDGTVKLRGFSVGVWWRDDYHWYHFAKELGADASVSRFSRRELMSAIAEQFEN